MSAAASGQNCAPAVWRVSRADLVGVSEAAARRAPGGPLNAEPGEYRYSAELDHSQNASHHRS